MERTQLQEKFKELFITTETQYINLFGEKWIGKSAFLENLKNEGFFDENKTFWLHKEKWQDWNDLSIEDNELETLIFESDESFYFPEFRSFIESKMINWKIIFISIEEIKEDGVTVFKIPGIFFREFTELSGSPISVKELMLGNLDIKKINELLSNYIGSGYFPKNIENPSGIFSEFEEKCAIMKQELYVKEYEDFMEFLRTLAMNTWSLFKADQFAKNIWISRRKIHKYTELLMKYNHIQAIGPWSENTITETTRHVKVYFSDLAFLHAILWDFHFQWSMKQWAVENFIFLELREKLGNTHDVYFYRKKSGAEISFLLIEKNTKLLTPIEVNVRETEAISQAIRSFDENYHNRVDYYMLLNESRYSKKNLGEKSFITIPHFAI